MIPFRVSRCQIGTTGTVVLHPGTILRKSILRIPEHRFLLMRLMRPLPTLNPSFPLIHEPHVWLNCPRLAA